jgi:histidinol phosphatase-like PHP family hydrolase
MSRQKVVDFHTHTFLSDGELCPSELAQRARMEGYSVLGIADHADASTLDFIVDAAVKAAESLNGAYGDFSVIPGVELTHAPPLRIGALIYKARRLGAKCIVVHGETPVEPVERGTNLAAIEGGCDILAHPGFILEREARLAGEMGVYLEISARGGHSLANGLVASLARKAGAKLLINSDAHAPKDLLSPYFRRKVGLGCGLEEAEYEAALDNAKTLAEKLLGKTIRV